MTDKIGVIVLHLNVINIVMIMLVVTHFIKMKALRHSTTFLSHKIIAAFFSRQQKTESVIIDNHRPTCAEIDEAGSITGIAEKNDLAVRIGISDA